MKARENPFATDRIEAELSFEFQWYACDWRSFTERWEKLNYRAALVGPHGSGKSTLLRTLENRISKHSTVIHLFLNDQKPILEKCEWQQLQMANSDDTVILLDGAERLKRRDWMRFQRSICARPAPLRALVSQHAPNRFRSPTLLNTHTTPALLAHLIEQLDVNFAASLTEPEVCRLFQRHRGNLRTALWECYDRCSDRPQSSG